MDYNFWDDRTHEVEINPCEGCYDYQNGKCISNGGCGDGGTDVEDVTRKATEEIRILFVIKENINNIGDRKKERM